jgi:hypothetical protein
VIYPVKLIRTGFCTALFLLSACMSDEQRARLEDQAGTPVTCQAGVDCQDKWRRARQWLEDNSHFPILKQTDDVITTDAGMDSTYPVLSLRKFPEADDPGSFHIVMTADCRNMLGCAPTELQMSASFSQEVGDADDTPDDTGNDVDIGATFAADGTSSQAGVIVESVAPNTPAAKSGLMAGDRIMKFNGAAVSTVEKLQDVLKASPEGSVVPLQYARGGRIFVVYLRI